LMRRTLKGSHAHDAGGVMLKGKRKRDLAKGVTRLTSP
jgi:hypothetical protein